MMEQSSTIDQPSWFQDAMKKGLLLGAVHIILFLVIYAAFPEKLTSFSYLFVILALNIGYCIYQGSEWRNQIGGYIDFGGAFRYIFVLLLFSGLLYTVFSAIFLLIDPSFPELMARSQLDTSLYWAGKLGAPEETLEQMRDQYDPDEMARRYNFSGLLTGLGISAIFYAIGALLMALIVRRREPEIM